jgi:hypothetical protein
MEVLANSVWNGKLVDLVDGCISPWCSSMDQGEDGHNDMGSWNESFTMGEVLPGMVI